MEGKYGVLVCYSYYSVRMDELVYSGNTNERVKFGKKKKKKERSWVEGP